MSKNSLILVMQNKQENPTIDMVKVQIKSEKLTPFGGIFSIMEQFDSTLSSVIDSTLGLRCRSFHFMACFRGQSVCSCNRMSDILCEPVFLLLSSFQVISLDGFILWSIMIYRKVFHYQNREDGFCLLETVSANPLVPSLLPLLPSLYHIRHRSQ